MDKNTRFVHGIEVPRLITRGFSFTKMELDMIHRKAIAQGDGNDSAALRSILREWQDMNAMLTRIAITPAGQQAIASEAPRE